MVPSRLTEAIFLGFLQGLTEFLPVSSSGHLVLFQNIFGIDKPEIFFDTFLHIGTMCATIAFFRNDLADIFISVKKGDGKGNNYLLLIFISLIPTMLLGLLIESRFSYFFGSISVVRVGFLITALILLIPAALRLRPAGHVSPAVALLIGVVQGISVVPGISRSGSTIISGVAGGVDYSESFRFSFIISIPAISGAMALNLMKGNISYSFSLFAMFGGTLAAFLSGYIALFILRKVVTNMKIHFFSVYLAIAFLLTLFIG